jgi:hypothetical protein
MWHPSCLLPRKRNWISLTALIISTNTSFVSNVFCRLFKCTFQTVPCRVFDNDKEPQGRTSCAFISYNYILFYQSLSSIFLDKKFFGRENVTNQKHELHVGCDRCWSDYSSIFNLILGHCDARWKEDSADSTFVIIKDLCLKVIFTNDLRPMHCEHYI